MRGFSNLPNELITMILPNVLPEDLENFAQVSKNVQARARLFLKQHRALIRKYHTLRSDGDIPEVLEEVLRNSRLGYYVREINVDINGTEIEDPYIPDLELVNKAAAESQYIVREDGLETCDWNTWVNIMQEDQGDDLWLSILLPLLPNLHTFSAEGWDPEMSYRCTARAFKNISQSTEPPLPCLRMLRARSDPVSSAMKTWIGPLSYFKALENVAADWATILPNGCDFHAWIPEALPSSLLSLTLHDRKAEYAGLYGGLVSAILAHTAELPKFERLTLVSNGTVDKRALQQVGQDTRISVVLLAAGG